MGRINEFSYTFNYTKGWLSTCHNPYTIYTPCCDRGTYGSEHEIWEYETSLHFETGQWNAGGEPAKVRGTVFSDKSIWYHTGTRELTICVAEGLHCSVGCLWLILTWQSGKHMNQWSRWTNGVVLDVGAKHGQGRLQNSSFRRRGGITQITRRGPPLALRVQTLSGSYAHDSAAIRSRFPDFPL